MLADHPYSPKIAGSIGKVSREDRWERLSDTQKSQLATTYGGISGKVKSAPDACVWSA